MKFWGFTISTSQFKIWRKSTFITNTSKMKRLSKSSRIKLISWTRKMTSSRDNAISSKAMKMVTWQKLNTKTWKGSWMTLLSRTRLWERTLPRLLSSLELLKISSWQLKRKKKKLSTPRLKPPKRLRFKKKSLKAQEWPREILMSRLCPWNQHSTLIEKCFRPKLTT